MTRRQRLKTCLRDWCECGDGPTMAPARFRTDTPGGRGVRIAEPLALRGRRFLCINCQDWLDPEPAWDWLEGGTT